MPLIWLFSLIKKRYRSVFFGYFCLSLFLFIDYYFCFNTITNDMINKRLICNIDYFKPTKACFFFTFILDTIFFINLLLEYKIQYIIYSILCTMYIVLNIVLFFFHQTIDNSYRLNQADSLDTEGSFLEKKIVKMS